MNVHVEAVGPSRKQIAIEVPAAEVDSAYQDAVTNYQRFARIPGFRPGKAPVNMVKSRFKKEILKDLKEFLIPRHYHDALKQEKIDVVRVIEVTDAEPAEGKPFAFTVTVDVVPEFELPDYKSIRIAPQPVEVTDASVDEVIDQMRDRMATYEVVEGRVAEKTDRVSVNYEATMDGQPMVDKVGEHKILAQAKDIGVILDPNYSFIQEFAEGLVGLKAGDKKNIEVNFDENFVEKSLANKKAIYAVEVLKVEVKKLPEVTPEFIKSIGGETLESLRERIRADLTRMKADQERRRVRDEIAKQLNEQTAMTLPQSEVQRQTANEVYDMVQYNTSRGLAREAIEENREQIFSAAAKSAEDRLKLRYILLKIAGSEKFDVTGNEIEQHIRHLAQRAHKDPAKVKAEFQKNGVMDDVKDDLLVEKAMNFLMEQQQPAPAAA